MRSEDSLLITFYDLKRLGRRYVRTLKRIALWTFCIAFLFLLFRQPSYLAQATLKHLKSPNDFSDISKDIFKELSSTANPPLFSVMHSERILKNAIEALGMHVIVSSPGSFRRILQRALENLLCEFGRKPSDLDNFSFRAVTFDEETPLQLYVRPLSFDRFEILDAKKNRIAYGQLGQRLSLEKCVFTLASFPKKVIYDRAYPLTILPWIRMVQRIRKAFDIRVHKLEKAVYYLYFKHSDRYLAAEFLNQVMKSYQEYCQRENDEIYNTQVAYLQKRQNELIAEYNRDLELHVEYLKKNIRENGALKFSNVLSTLTGPQTTFSSKLFEVDLDLKRLEPLEQHLDASIETLPEASSEKKYDALTLQSARNLYQHYTEKKDQYEADLKQRIFLRSKLDDPEVELSTLATFLTDPISASLAQQASNIALKIRDGENRTTREQERLKEELDTQKRYLREHLAHRIELEKTQCDLLSRKIHDLRCQTNYLLTEEKRLLQEKMEELKVKMHSLPEKWQRENLLLLKKDLGARILESMTQLIETKNLSQKLFYVSSTYLDAAFPPLEPKPPLLFFTTFFTTLFACSIFYVYKFCALLVKGFPLSPGSLHALGYPSYGVLSLKSNDPLEALSSSDLEVLRKVAHFLFTKPRHSCIALLEGKTAFSLPLAELLFAMGKKILHIRYTSQRTENNILGLSSFIQNASKELPIERLAHYDTVTVGLFSPVESQMLAHPSWLSSLAEIKKNYDILLLSTEATIGQSDAHLFGQISDALVIAIHDESQEDLAHYSRWSESEKKSRLAFVHLQPHPIKLSNRPLPIMDFFEPIYSFCIKKWRSNAH